MAMPLGKGGDRFSQHRSWTAMAVLDRGQGDPRRRKPESGGGCVEVEDGGAPHERVSRIRPGGVEALLTREARL